MSDSSHGLRVAPFVLVLGIVAAPAGVAGEHPHKAHANQPNKGAQGAAAAEHRAMMQQQRAAVQNQMANQHRLALQNQAANQHRAEAHGVAHRGGTGHRGGAGMGLAGHQNSAAMVSSLRSVATRLRQADHDYNGHRVQAIHQVDQAIRSLQANNRGAGSGVFGIPPQVAYHSAGGAGLGNTRGVGAGTGSTHRLSQAESDAHLHQAHQQLMAIETRMAGGAGAGINNGMGSSVGTGTGSGHPQAHSHVRQALQHLNTALATR